MSKVFDYLFHDLKIAKLHPYDVVMSSLNLLQDYLLNRKQRTKVDSFFVLGKMFYLKYHKALS